MTKKLLPALIGVALAGGMTAASADVTVFGHLDTSIDNIDVSDTDFGGNISFDDTNMHCTTCSIGFKGSEDLGNGLQAIFSLDFQFNTTERGNRGSSGQQIDTFKHWYDPSGLGQEGLADSITDRDQWLGLKGGFGQVRLGTISTVYKSHGAMIDPMYRTALQGREHGLQSFAFHSGAGEETQGRATNTIRWDSANFSGFKLGATYTIDNNKEDGEDDNPYGIGGSYENGGILVFADYITNDGSSAVLNHSDTSAWKLGGKYTFGDFAVMGQYEDFESADTTEDLDGQLWHIGGTFTMGNNMIYAAYGQNEVDDAGVQVADGNAWTIAAMHSMSKRTKVYLGYNKIDEDYDTTENFEKDEISLGVKHKF